MTMTPQQEKELIQLITASWLGGIDPEITAINIKDHFDNSICLQKLHSEIKQAYRSFDNKTLSLPSWDETTLEIKGNWEH